MLTDLGHSFYSYFLGGGTLGCMHGLFSFGGSSFRAPWYVCIGLSLPLGFGVSRAYGHMMMMMMMIESINQSINQSISLHLTQIPIHLY